MITYSIEQVNEIIRPGLISKTPKIKYSYRQVKNNITKWDLLKISLIKYLKNENQENLILFLNNTLGENFTIRELYNYMNNISLNDDKCPICGEPYELISLLTGYNKCINYNQHLFDTIKTKRDIYEYICSIINTFTSAGFVNSLKKHPINELIEYNWSNPEDLYDYLHDNQYAICRCEECNNKASFRSFTTGYKDFCSIECNNKWLSYSRTGNNNPFHNITDESRKKMGAKISKLVKERIANGTFTPNITNSWCHSRIKINNLKFRSSIECYFYFLNLDLKLEYEKLRIPYIHNNESHTYIVDFVDNINKNVYELKPSTLVNNTINNLKSNALNKWCNDNNYKYNIITEEYFRDKIFDLNLLKSSPQYDKLKRLITVYFNKENIINYEN